MEKKEKYNKMLQEDVGKLITKLAIPTVTSMLVTAIYNMADTYFVSKLGTNQAAAVGIVFPIMAIIQAVGFTVGMGSGSLISRLLGEKKNNKANEVASSGFFLGILLGIIIAGFSTLSLAPLMRLAGSTEQIVPYAKDYAKYILLAAPIMITSFVLNNILRAEGRAFFSMIGLTTGGILNIVLDPICIFKLDMGIKGAATATAISQCISFMILLSCFLRKITFTRISFRYISKKIGTYFNILANGAPSFCRQGLASLATMFLNKSAKLYGGGAAIAAMSIVGKIFMLIFSVLIGIGQGYQPVVGYNFGAKRYDRVKKAFFFTTKVGIVVMTILSAIGYIYAPVIMGWFCSDSERASVMKVGVEAFRAQCFVMPIVPISVVCNMTFQGIGKYIWATITSAARQGIFFLPLILTLPKWFSIRGVELAQPVADVCTFCFVIPFMLIFFKELKEKQISKSTI